ncbi:MAG: hypothetical protein Kow00117_06250 [Phototrophicales bacterium]
MADGSHITPDYFRTILVTVVGQAYAAAGYELEERPVQWAGGRFRFLKKMSNDLTAVIEYQLLTYVDSEWAVGQPSRFKVTLICTDGRRRDLSALVVEDFGVAILPSATHWWTFQNLDELGKALAEAGHLVVGYGIPWLAGDLKPDETQ